MRAIPYILYLFLIALHQVIFKDVTSIAGASVNITAFLVLAVALYKTELVAIWFGFTAGIVVVAGSPSIIGWQALALGTLGFIAYHVRERLNLDSIYARLLLVFCGVLIHNTLSLIMNGATEFLYLLWTSALTGAVYTTAMAWLFFLFKGGYITYARVKALF